MVDDFNEETRKVVLASSIEKAREALRIDPNPYSPSAHALRGILSHFPATEEPGEDAQMIDAGTKYFTDILSHPEIEGMFTPERFISEDRIGSFVYVYKGNLSDYLAQCLKVHSPGRVYTSRAVEIIVAKPDNPQAIMPENNENLRREVLLMQQPGIREFAPMLMGMRTLTESERVVMARLYFEYTRVFPSKDDVREFIEGAIPPDRLAVVMECIDGGEDLLEADVHTKKIDETYRPEFGTLEFWDRILFQVLMVAQAMNYYGYEASELGKNASFLHRDYRGHPGAPRILMVDYGARALPFVSSDPENKAAREERMIVEFQSVADNIMNNLLGRLPMGSVRDQILARVERIRRTNATGSFLDLAIEIDDQNEGVFSIEYAKITGRDLHHFKTQA